MDSILESMNTNSPFKISLVDSLELLAKKCNLSCERCMITSIKTRVFHARHSKKLDTQSHIPYIKGNLISLGRLITSTVSFVKIR